MFNSYASGGRATASANNYLKINAVNGTLVKNHPQSIFVHAKADSTIFDPTNPRCNFPNAETYMRSEADMEWNGDSWRPVMRERAAKRDVEVPCVVLQAMIVGDGLFLCEIVPTDKFFVGASEDDVETGG